MKKLIVSLVAALSFLSPAFAAGGGMQWDRFPVEKMTDVAALQNGAKLFVNYCLNCHSAAYMRYNRMRDIGLTRRAFVGSLLGRRPGERLSSRRPDRFTIGQGELDLAVPRPRRTARNPFTPARIHILQIQIVRLEYMHIAVENLVPVFCHKMPFSLIHWPLSILSRNVPAKAQSRSV